MVDRRLISSVIPITQILSSNQTENPRAASSMLILTYSILDRRFPNLVIQPCRKRNEYSVFCEKVDIAGSSESTTIYLADIEYASYNNFAHVIKNGQFFLIRCNDKRLEVILGHSTEYLKEVDCHVDRILTRTQFKKKYSKPDLSELY